MFSPASRRAFSILLVVALALTTAFAQSRPARQKPSRRSQRQRHLPNTHPKSHRTLRL